MIVNYASREIYAAQNTLGNSILSGDYYYIKNVRSGKYLDAEGGSSNNGTNIIQYRFTGGQNQQWKITFNSTGHFGGLYHITSRMNTSMALKVENASGNNGVNILLGTKQNTVNFYYSIQRLSNSSYKILTNASNSTRALTVESASCDDCANVFQYQFNNTDNDSWLIEPVSGYIPSYGVEYAYSNYDAGNTNHISTYPFLEGADCANFVSQCLCAAGKHYDGNWRINKKNNTYLSPFYNVSQTEGISRLNYTWELSDPSPWISAIQFENYWTGKVTSAQYSLSNIINNNISSSASKVGDVMQILEKTNYIFPESLFHNDYEACHTMYVTQNSNNNKLGGYKLTYHSSNAKDKSLTEVCNYYYDENDPSSLNNHKIKVFNI